KPLFQTAEGVFSVTLPNKNNINSVLREERVPYLYNRDVKNEILNYIKAKKKITRKDVENEFGFGTTKAFILLKELCENKLIMQIKQGKQTTYVIRN
ncbi:MAG: AAA family ATPase, partial [Candidatus Riflebacteria bacterium]|nr:AAA family ATPase [Candidatus Riflebacteria bacterium]